MRQKEGRLRIELNIGGRDCFMDRCRLGGCALSYCSSIQYTVNASCFHDRSTRVQGSRRAAEADALSPDQERAQGYALQHEQPAGVHAALRAACRQAPRGRARARRRPWRLQAQKHSCLQTRSAGEQTLCEARKCKGSCLPVCRINLTMEPASCTVVALSLCLSLSLSHTHTRRHATLHN